MRTLALLDLPPRHIAIEQQVPMLRHMRRARSVHQHRAVSVRDLTAQLRDLATSKSEPTSQSAILPKTGSSPSQGARNSANSAGDLSARSAEISVTVSAANPSSPARTSSISVPG